MSTTLESSHEASTSSVPEVLRETVEDRTGEYEMSVRLLHEFGTTTGYLTKAKVGELAREASKHDVLFSDYTEGHKLETFLDVFMDPRGVWFELFRLDTEEVVGAAYITKVIPGYDASAHFAFWDQVASGRQSLIQSLMHFVFRRYNLRRLSVEVPPYQRGTIRFVERLGFTKEGEKREAVQYKGRWFPLLLFGITQGELEEIVNV